MKNKEKLKRYEQVNACECLEELADVILSFADNIGDIDGRINVFDAEKMAVNCLDYNLENPNILTRMWGIRQQAMYIINYPVGSLITIKPYKIKGKL